MNMIFGDTRMWAIRRRIQYGIGYFVTLMSVLIGCYFLFFYAEPTCFDGRQNGNELRVDCGGSCVRICAVSVTAPRVLWAESFPAITGQYNAVAYVENPNEGAGTPALSYTFTLSDGEGVIATRSGATVLPPDSTYPIFEARIDTGERIPTRTTLVLEAEPTWLPATIGREQFKTTTLDLIGVEDRPRLNARLENTELTPARDVEVVATIFDAGGNPLTSSQTFVADFPARTSRDIVFTWPRPIAKTVRTCAVPTDVVVAIDLSGSMNNDGENPPEPVTSVLAAASAFVTNLRQGDQVSVVTFASDATTTRTLSTDITSSAAAITRLTIDPKEERGNTNTAAGLTAALGELTSPRNNVDARNVVILLTDGLATAPSPNPDAAATSAAARLKDANVTVFTIGLGSGVNADFLRSVASSPEQAFLAPTTATLGQIYQTITAAICEDGPARIDIIPKTITNFPTLAP